MNKHSRQLAVWLTALISVLVLTLAEAAPSLQVKGLFAGRALVEVAGKQHLMKQGETVDGFTLIEANSHFAVIEVDGKRSKLTISKRIAADFAKAAYQEVRIQPDDRGHFETPARINKRAVKVVVDTGATMVSMSRDAAEALRLKYRNGRQVPVNTANGITAAYMVKLNSVSVGAVTVHNVDALVHEGSSPSMILLGNSYLRRVNMKKENGVLVLQSQQ